jgi:hypothetical protein
MQIRITGKAASQPGTWFACDESSVRVSWCRAPAVGHDLEEPIGSFDEVLALLKDIVPDGREPHVTCASKQQLLRNELLELLDPLGNDRLRDAELARSRGEAARLADTHERLEVCIHVHRVSVVSFPFRPYVDIRAAGRR